MSAENESDAAAAAEPSQPTVLVVDDYADVRHMLASALALHGYRVVEAANGWAAIDVAAREHPQAILMDLQMPMLDGFETTELLRGNDELRDVPIIALTAHTSLDNRAEAAEAGITAFLTKPIDPDDLCRVIGHCLAGQKTVH